MSNLQPARLITTTCLSLAAFGFFFATAVTVKAEDATSSPRPSKTVATSPQLNREGLNRSPLPERTPSADKINQYKQRASTEIDLRVTSLNNLINRLNGMKHLSADRKSSLITQIQTNITSLTTLKAKIAADTDLATLRTDVQSITKAYRIFWLFMPKISIMSAADRIMDITTYVATLFPKAQAKIDAAKAAGQDVSALQGYLDDAKIKVTDANTQAQNAVNTVNVLIPDNGNDQVLQSNIAALKSARGMIKTAMTDLRAVREDLRRILEFVRQNRSPGPSHTPRPSTTPLATSTATTSPVASPTP